MRFMIQWEIHPDKRHAVFAGFAAMDLSDYQTMAGPAVKTIGRWHDLITGRGVLILETDDAEALSQSLLSWNAVVDFEVAVVHTDEEAHALLQKSMPEE